MANLVPQSAKKHIHNEYWIRVITVWLFVLGTGCLIVGALHIPAYVLVNDQVATYAAWQAEVVDTKDTFTMYAEEISNDNKIHSLLRKADESMTFSSVADTLFMTAGPEITIEGFSMTREQGDVEADETDKDNKESGVELSRVAIRGTAATRSGLADFKTALEETPMFSEVSLPLSNLAKDANLPFNISFVVRIETP